MPEPWSDRVVLVTGGSGLVGLGITRAFLKLEAQVVIVGSTEERLRRGLRELADVGLETGGRAADLRSLAEVRRLFETVERQRGPVGVLVNCAGLNFNRPIAEVVEAEYDRVMDTNVKAAFFASQIAAERMIAAGRGGRIVNITSGNYRYARPNAAVYAASKAALEMLTRSFALELGPHRITVNAVAPGLVAAPGAAARPAFARVADYYQTNAPLGHLVTPDDVAQAVIFLASERAATITGETIVVDGGFSAGRFDFPLRSDGKD